MSECLSKSSDARKYSIALQNLDCGGDLATKLMEFSKKLETLLNKLQDLRKRGVNSEDAYDRYFKILDDKLEWYQKAEAQYGIGDWAPTIKETNNQE